MLSRIAGYECSARAVASRQRTVMAPPLCQGPAEEFAVIGALLRAAPAYVSAEDLLVAVCRCSCARRSPQGTARH